MLSQSTYDELLGMGESDRLIAVVRCDATEVLSRGTRRERVQLRTTVVAGTADADAGQSVLFVRFAQANTLMQPGKLYLTAAYRGEWVPAWSLVEWRQLAETEADAALNAARQGLAARAQETGLR